MIKSCRILIQSIVLIITPTLTLHAAQITFLPELFISEEYTDNLFLDSDDDAKVDDYITTAGLSLTADISTRTSGLSLNYSPSYSSFADTEDLDFWRHSASIRIWKDFKRNTQLALSSIYLETENPRDESDEPDQSLDTTETAVSGISADDTRRGRNRYRQNANTLRLSHQYGAQNSVFGAIEYRIFEDIDPPAGIERDNHQIWRPSIGIEHWFNQNWGTAVNASYSNRTYDDRDDRTESYGSLRLLRRFSRKLSGFIQYEHTILDFDQETEDEDYQLYAPSAGINYQLGKSTNLDIGAGYYSQDFDQTDDEEGFYVNSNIIHNISYRSGFITLSASSGYEVEDTGTQDLGLRLFYMGGIDTGYDFTRKLSGKFYTAYRINDYLNETPDRTDQIFNAGTGISYQALKWMEIQLLYDHQNIASDDETQEYAENSVVLRLTMAPANPFRLN